MIYRMFVLLLWCAAMVSPAAGQQVIGGRVLAGNEPVANQPVSLHHVTDDGGSTLASDTTDAAGRFALNPAELPATGVLFVATRYENQLYIGEPFRRGEEPADYMLAVGPGATPIDLGSPAGATQAPPPATVEDSRAGLVVVLIAAVLLVSAGLFMLRRSVPPQRRVLLEIAELDEHNAARPIRDYENRRRLLVERLRETV